MNILYVLCSMLCISCTNRDTVVDKSKLLGNDYRLFQQTPVWELAKAVEDESIVRIKKIAEEDTVDINFKESKYGHTLLMLTVKNEQYVSFKALLELKANPNIHDDYDGSSAIIDAASIESREAIKFLELLLEYGADPNDVETGDRQKGNTTRMTPLLEACRSSNRGTSSLEKVKLLVNAGANLNYKNEFNQSPLSEALIHDSYDIILYLIEKGVDYNVIISRVEGKEYYLWDELRFKLHPLDSEEYKQKMEIVSFLESKGINYRELPISDYVVEEAKKLYPKDWKEYLKKY